MKEILFRGKTKGSSVWVEGYFYEECGETYIIEERQKKFNDMTYRNAPHIVDPETVGQSICLTDTNGVKIFEGDIIEECDEDDLKHVFTIKDISTYNNEFWFRNSSRKYFKVIGNIYDNPELLGA
jgi:uncharacterized phage protein (TIGR01671 family)